MGKFYFAFAWDIIVNLHVCICKNKICIWSDQGVNLPICKYTPVCICVRMRHLLTPSKICTPEYIYTCVFLAHANWTLFYFILKYVKHDEYTCTCNNIGQEKKRNRLRNVCLFSLLGLFYTPANSYVRVRTLPLSSIFLPSYVMM